MGRYYRVNFKSWEYCIFISPSMMPIWHASKRKNSSSYFLPGLLTLMWLTFMLVVPLSSAPFKWFITSLLSGRFAFHWLPLVHCFYICIGALLMELPLWFISSGMNELVQPWRKENHSKPTHENMTTIGKFLKRY